MPIQHFSLTGLMGDIQDIEINEAYTANPHSGTNSTRIIYHLNGSADAEGFHYCGMGQATRTPCRWAGGYWLNPPDNRGEVADEGYDLTGFTRLTFWARTDANDTAAVQFFVGGVGWGIPTVPPYPDSLRSPRRSAWLILGPEWTRYEIDLTGADLTYVIGGFGWVSTWSNNGVSQPNRRTLVFYVDDIRFER